jgi:two-component system, NarL family, sensor histidine kinase LiaS
LTNVTKHAQATRVYIKFMRNRRFLRGVIRDDGDGFDVQAVLTRRGSRGLGLTGIRERLSAVGGTLDIIATPRGGTQLVLTVPLEADNAEPDSPR